MFLIKKKQFNYVKLKDICNSENAKISIKDIENNRGEYPIYGASGLIKYIDKYEMLVDYVAVIKDGAGVGRTYCYSKNTSVIYTMSYLLPKDGITVRYLESLVRFLELGKKCIGATIPHIYFKDYGKTIVPYPTLELQNEFTNFVQHLDKSKFAIKEAMNYSQRIFDGILRESLK